jgi:superfamily II DNA or RNA helicase
MKVIIDSVIRIRDMPAELLKQIKAELTMKNPEYAKKKAIGIPLWGVQEYIQLWSEQNGELILPRGYYARLWELAGLKREDIQDNRIKLARIEYPSRPNLRKYQAPALQKAVDWEQGVTIMPCGAGKTETADGMVAEIGQPTLWITHTMDLLQQSMDRAVSRLGLTGNMIGIIQGENCSIGTHMTFATVQTLVKRNLSEIKNRFGCVIIDEAHLVFKDASKTRMFESVISQLPAYYRFGMTASEYRSDGLISTMFHVIGPKIYEIEQDDPRLPTVRPKVEFIETYFSYYVPEDEMLNVQQMVRDMRLDTCRNDIIKSLLNDIAAAGDYCLVLGDSLAHLQELKEHVRDFCGVHAAFVCGETPKKERDKIMSGMRAGKYQFLFATYQLAKLGLDIPRLNKLVLSTPKRDKTSIQQAVGRIMRPFEGKGQPVVYDIWDSCIPQLRHWARDRVAVYKNLGCEVIGGPKVRVHRKGISA